MMNRFILPALLCLLFFSYQDTGWSIYDDVTLFVTHVLDGDTIDISDGRRIRLLGIDCPEISENDKLAYDVLKTGISKEIFLTVGREAREFVRDVTMDCELKIKTDLVNSTSDHFDKYGRTLAYVKVYWKEPPEFLLKDMGKKEIKRWKSKWVSLNILLLSNGYAKVYNRFPFTNRQRFTAEERKAKMDKKGIWGMLTKEIKSN